MKVSKAALLTAFVALGLLLSACGGGNDAADKQKIAVVMSGSRDDNSWNAAAYQALEALSDRGVEVVYRDNVSREEARQALHDYAEQGNTLVIGHASDFGDAVIGVAAEQGRVNFAWAGGVDRAATNVADYDYPFYEAAYPIGVIAGHMTESGWIGAIGFDIPMCNAIANAFHEGAQSVRQELGTATLAVGDWEDAAEARELMSYAGSVDFWIVCGPGPLLAAIEVARERGGYVTGFAADMSEKAPDVVLLNLVWNLEPLYQRMLDDIEAGAFGHTFYQMGVADDVIQVVYNNALKNQIPTEAVAAADQALADIKSGALVVPYNPRR